MDDDQYAVEQRVKFGLPTDPATRDRADMETEQRGHDNTVEIGVTVTDEEDAAFRRPRTTLHSSDTRGDQ